MLDETFILIFSLVCNLGGVTFFTISFLIIRKIKNLFPGSRIIRKWVIIQGLIALFFFGYIVNLVCLIMDLTDYLAVMTAIVYFFGALFVFIVMSLSFRTYQLILMEPVSKKEK